MLLWNRTTVVMLFFLVGYFLLVLIGTFCISHPDKKTNVVGYSLLLLGATAIIFISIKYFFDISMVQFLASF